VKKLALYDGADQEAYLMAGMSLPMKIRAASFPLGTRAVDRAPARR